MLLDAGADVNARNINGWTSLMFAAKDNKNPSDTWFWMLRLSYAKKDDWTPLMLAASDNNPEVIRVLLKAGVIVVLKIFGVRLL